MAVTPTRVVLFLIGLFAAVGLVTYGSGVLAPVQPTDGVVASRTTAQDAPKPSGVVAPAKPSGPSTGSASPTPDQPPVAASSGQAKVEDQTSSGKEDAAADVASAGAQTTPSSEPNDEPSFDLLRVEPNGSAVIAGKAAPGASVDIVSGSDVLGQATASPQGDFAIALDQPLSAGDHTLVLRANGRGGVQTSRETAIVSLPSGAGGEVLAMVEEPGQPSRLMEVPDAKPVGEATISQPQDSVTREAATAKAQTAAALQPAEPASRTSAAAEAPVPVVTEEPADTADVPSQKPADITAAAVEPAETVQAQPSNGVTDAPTVEAVEIEGDMVFVAGRGAPGSKLRAYATDVFLGEATASPEGQFLVEANRSLPVGHYTIRIDSIGKDGRSVTARAAVPFEREAGETLAAVAPAPAATGSATGNGSATPQAGEGDDETAPAAVQQQGATTTVTPISPAAQETAAVEPVEPGAAITPEQPTATAPALERSDDAVIIRRGDTLWRISKRAYGRGVRYSTIYLANQDQIEDPDRIWPGQIFRMPESTQQGEKADMSQLGNQAVTRE